MTASEGKKKKRKWLNYTLNGLLVLIVLTLIIPSWRSTFQSWFTYYSLVEVDFDKTESVPFPEEQKNWELINADGELINFAEYEGKPIVIQFWATWCTFCKAQFPDLKSLRENFDNDIAFIAVTNEPLEVLQASGYQEDYDFLFCSQYFPEFFQVKVYPTLMIMDKNMNVVFSMEGAGDVDSDENVAFLKGLL